MPEVTAETPARTGTLHPASERAEEGRTRVRVPDDREDAESREGQELIDAAARSDKKRDKLSPEEQVNALEWFLSDTDATDLTHSFDINVGSPSRKRWLTWTIRPVDMDKLRRIRRASQSGNRRERRAGNTDIDAQEANIQIVLEGTVDPDLREAARSIGTVDPAVAVRSRFAHKPGLLDQIAGEIMALSGYDDEDIREVDAARG